MTDVLIKRGEDIQTQNVRLPCDDRQRVCWSFIGPEPGGQESTMRE